MLVADVPWAYPNSGFTRSFDLTTAWLAMYLPRSVVSEYMRIDWETVGNCIHRATNDIEPDRRRRLDGLVNIGIDETSYKKGHKYITVIVNHDTNTVVWAAQGHGKGVLKQFYETLTPEQLSGIKVVTDDGARWITECVNEYTPDCERTLIRFTWFSGPWMLLTKFVKKQPGCQRQERRPKRLKTPVMLSIKHRRISQRIRLSKLS